MPKVVLKKLSLEGEVEVVVMYGRAIFCMNQRLKRGGYSMQNLDTATLKINFPPLKHICSSHTTLLKRQYFPFIHTILRINVDIFYLVCLFFIVDKDLTKSRSSG